jgi:small-conductance mechanosensitive channel
VQTDIRMAILKRFREEGIEIPNPQYDIHLRDLDVVKRYLAEAAERAAQERRSSAASAVSAVLQPKT